MARMTTPAEDTLTALIHLLDREGYDAVTADQLARQAGIGDIGTQGKFVRFGPVESLPESRQLRLERLYKGAKLNPALKTILVPAPMTSPVGGKPVRNTEVLTWAAQLIRSILLDDAAAA